MTLQGRLDRIKQLDLQLGLELAATNGDHR
jgi:hypothetical protein